MHMTAKYFLIVDVVATESIEGSNQNRKVQHKTKLSNDLQVPGCQIVVPRGDSPA